MKKLRITYTWQEKQHEIENTSNKRIRDTRDGMEKQHEIDNL